MFLFEVLSRLAGAFDAASDMRSIAASTEMNSLLRVRMVRVLSLSHGAGWHVDAETAEREPHIGRQLASYIRVTLIVVVVLPSSRTVAVPDILAVNSAQPKPSLSGISAAGSGLSPMTVPPPSSSAMNLAGVAMVVVPVHAVGKPAGSIVILALTRFRLRPVGLGRVPWNPA